MKKNLLSVGAVFLFGATFAQTIVGTTPEKKNVVLEEYTGIYCQFCPDGHKRANDMKDQSPDDFILINIHEGGYATPSGTDPDFRTTYGTAIGSDAGSSSIGWPSGSVNRRVFSGSETAMSRGDWATHAATILSEDSPVNVAVEATYNSSTGKVDVLVEAYYTDNTYASSSNKINVFVLQDNVLGPQTGATTWYPEMILSNGMYRHMHMLRHSFTGNFGDDIKTPTTGTLVTKSYNYTPPADINGVPVSIADLSIAVSIAEGQQEIITGAYAHVDIPSTVKTDLSVTNKTAGTSDYCATSFDAVVELRNNFSNTITSFDLDVLINGVAAKTISYSGSLAGGSKTTLTEAGISPVSGSNVIAFSSPYNINGGALMDTDFLNNIAEATTILKVPGSAVSSPKSIEFAGLAYGEIPSDLFLDNPDDFSIITLQAQHGNNVTWNLGGFGNSDGTLRWACDAANGISGSVFTEKLDLSGSDDAVLRFSYAYAQLAGGENDELVAYASKDCGSTWTKLWNKAGNDLATAPANSAARFYPIPTQWEQAIVLLTEFAGESEVIVKLTVNGAGGNAVYVDDLLVSGSNSQGWPVGIDEVNNMNNVSVYPNPASEVTTLSFQTAENRTIEIYSITGELVNTISSSKSNINVNVENLDAGLYNIKINTDSKISTARIVVK